MPEIIIAEEAGACYGVERALKLVAEAAQSGQGDVCTLGPLIHNPVVIDELSCLGVSVVNSPDVPAGTTLVLRTHGVTPQVEEQARTAGAVVLDATCPFVKRVHRAAERLEREGYQVLVVGESGHPEVEGIVGHAPSAIVLASADALEHIELRRKVGVVVQTTQKQDTVRDIVSQLVGRVDELRVFDTICDATSGHQGACAQLARKVEVMVVVGGRNSANTTHLAEIARGLCARTYHIERPDELDVAWFEGAERIGITAGASTPAAHIVAVRQRIAEITKA